jgi:hypothetical protein
MTKVSGDGSAVRSPGEPADGVLAEIDDRETELNKKLRRLRRRLHRQHLVGSPACFDERGTHISEPCQWDHLSKRAQETQVAIDKFCAS